MWYYMPCTYIQGLYYVVLYAVCIHKMPVLCGIICRVHILKASTMWYYMPCAYIKGLYYVVLYAVCIYTKGCQVNVPVLYILSPHD